MKKYAAYDSYNNKFFKDYDIAGTIRTNVGNPNLRTSWKILELNTDKIEKKQNEEVSDV